MQDSVIENSYTYQISSFDKIKNVFNSVIRFLSNLLFIAFVAIVIVVLIYSVYTKKNGTNGQAPAISAYVIISPSMVPTINVRDAVVAMRADASKLQKGDIITFTSTDARYTGLTVTHRILKVTKSDSGKLAFKTKGDNNTTPDDSLVLGENIFGKIVFVIPWLGFLQFFLTKSYGWILLVVLPCLCIIIIDIMKLIKTLKNNKITKDINFKNVEILELSDNNLDVNKEENSEIENLSVGVDMEVDFLSNDINSDTNLKTEEIEELSLEEVEKGSAGDDIELL